VGRVLRARKAEEDTHWCRRADLYCETELIFFQVFPDQTQSFIAAPASRRIAERFAVPFDLERLEVRGAATRFGEVTSHPNLGFAEIDFSRNGILAYRTGSSEGLNTMQWLDSAGNAPLGIEAGRYVYPHLSPDGRTD
jgi:hypothetical protein